MLSFLFVVEGKLFIKKSSSRMVCFEMQITKVVKFLLNFQVHFALCGQDNYVFER